MTQFPPELRWLRWQRGHLILYAGGELALSNITNFRLRTKPMFCTARSFCVAAVLLRPKLLMSLTKDTSELTGPKIVPRGRSDFLEVGTPMIYFFAMGAIVGILLGLRFKVFVLVPATLITAFAIVATVHGAKTIAVTILATTALLQIGYVLGCIAHAYADAFWQGRAASRHRASRSHPA
jgi:hypothetical protein